MPIVAAVGVVAVLGVVGVVAFGGDDDEAGGAASVGRIIRHDLEGGAMDTVTIKGTTATFTPLAEAPGLALPTDPRSNLIVTKNAEETELTVVDATTGEVRSIDLGSAAQEFGPIRLGDVYVGSSPAGDTGVYVDLQTGAVEELHDAFGVPGDVRLFAIMRLRDGLGMVYGDGGAGVFDVFAPSERRWYDGVVYDASGIKVLTGSVGTERTLTLYEDGLVVGQPVATVGRVRVRLQEGTSTALVVEEDGRILTADFTKGTITETARISAAVMNELDDLLNMTFVADNRFIVELATGWAVLDEKGEVVNRLDAADIEAGATELQLFDVGTECLVFRMDGLSRPRTAIVDIATGLLRIDVDGNAAGRSTTACSMMVYGDNETLVVDGAVVEVDGIVQDHSPDFTAVIVRERTNIDTAAVAMYTVRDGTLVDPVALEPGSFRYYFLAR